ncbi:MAG: hypothetical protein AUJ98_07550 [Bacteroidetes bacterium CG2_30_33_31]|nr:MAG: hypothetical protein AUJ98_07550 [Bacteroidetes bacterium CG2_30_33_31]
MRQLPERTVERLSQYRRVLLRLLSIKKEYIYSHELASLLHITAVQVRRDIMLIGHTGTLRLGYKIKDLVDLISTIIDTPGKRNLAIVGIGNLGQALINYIASNQDKIIPVAIFDVNEKKIGSTFHGVTCYSMDMMEEIVKKESITIALLTLPPQFAQSTANRLIEAGVKGIMNFTPTLLNLQGAFLEQYDMITSLEKVAYFSKPKFFVS